MAFITFINIEGGNPEAEAQLSAVTNEFRATIQRTVSAVTIPSGTTVIATHAFNGCSGLTEVTIPSSVTEIQISAFTENDSLATITFEGDNPPTVADNAFSNLPADVEVVVPSGATEAYSGVVENIEESTIPHVTLTYANGSAYTYTYRDGVIPYTAFTNGTACKVEMNDGITNVGIAAFQNMSALSSLTLSTGITSIGNYAFQFDNLITGTISLPNIVTIGDGVFDGCSGITAVEFGENLTSIGDWAFMNCVNLSSITFHIPVAIGIPAGALEGISSDCHWLVPTEQFGFDLNSWNDTISFFNNYYGVQWQLCDLSGNPISKYEQFESFDDMRDTPSWAIDFSDPPTENLSVMFADEAVLIVQNGNEIFIPTIGTGLRIDQDGIAWNTTTEEQDDGTISDQYHEYINWWTEGGYLRYDLMGSLAEDYQYQPAGWTSNPESTDITGWLKPKW